ncbi:MAG: CHASE2 domain-containing protein [Phormidesmis sp.]
MRTWRQNWRTGILPGLSITGLVILSRLLGLLQPLEWKAFDLGLRGRLAETTDSRITIVAITEADIQASLGYPISDKDLAKLIQTLQTYQPRVIGIDIFRDTPVGEGFEDLAATLQNYNNIIGINEILSAYPVPPPPMLPEDRIGFVDALLDNDGSLRRSLLAGADGDDQYRFSLTLRLAQQYLLKDNLELANGIRDPQTMRFGETEIPRFRPHTGGYVWTDNGGNQTLINFRAGPMPFAQVTYEALVSGQVDPALIEDRVVLVGYTAEPVKDFVRSGAIAAENPSLIPGVTVQAHAVSQILSAVYDDRPFIKAVPDPLEYLLIVSLGLLGMALAHWRKKPTLHLLLVMAISAAWVLFCYSLLMASWWLPLVPAIAAFMLNAVALYPFYQAQAQLRSQINERQKLIDWTYNTIHNGPLQILSNMLSTWPEDQSAPPKTRPDLQALNQELRGIYEAMRQEMLLPSGQLVMTGARTVDLQMPLDALLYEIYKGTLERHRSFFEAVVQITTFESMADAHLTPTQKRALGRFLEEALLNVYQYAKETTRLTTKCRREGKYNVIQVVDNGGDLQAKRPKVQGGHGTRQAHKLARELGGKFERTAVQPQGVCCELRWPVRLPAWRRWLSE